MGKKRGLIAEASDASALTIAFEIPAMADSLSDVFVSFSAKKPDCELHLVTGRAEEILQKLSDGELDFCFITPDSVSIFNAEFISVSFPLRQGTLLSETAGLPVVPLESEPMMTRFFWKEEECHLNKKLFADQLNRFFQKSQMLS